MDLPSRQDPVQVCPVDSTWVSLITPKIENADVYRLRGGQRQAQYNQELQSESHLDSSMQQSRAAAAARPQAAVDAARARFLARKAGRA